MLTTVYIATQLNQIVVRKLTTALFVLSVVGVSTNARAYADDDFAARNHSWNGISNFLSMVVASGVSVEPSKRIDIGTLLINDALLVIHPTNELPIHGLTRFMKKGGRLAILDDFGTSQRFFRAFEFGLFSPVVEENTVRLRDNDNLLVATPAGRHPLTENVAALVANHPQTLHHSELKPVFAFGSSRSSALVLVGAVGDGRLIAIADSSVLINNMLEFRGNRVFARNLVRYLTKDNHGRLFVVVGNVALVDSVSGVIPRDSMDGIRQVLAMFARHQLSPPAVYAITGIVSTLLLLFAAAALPRASPYTALTKLLKQPEILAGFWGRVRFFSQSGRNLLNPLLVFRFELQEAIQRKLGFDKTPTLPELAVRSREIDIPEGEIEQLQRLLHELNELHSHSERSALPNISRRKFRKLVAKGTYMLHRLDTMVKNRETGS